LVHPCYCPHAPVVLLLSPCYRPPLHLHSFPTRRSSDLGSRKRDNSIRLWPSGVAIIAISTFWSPSPVTRPAHLPSTMPRPSSCRDRKSTRLNSSHVKISYAVFCLKKKRGTTRPPAADGA